MCSKQTLIAALALLMAASSCTVERQVFSDGQKIEWHKRAAVQLDDRAALAQMDTITVEVDDADMLPVSASTTYDTDVHEAISEPSSSTEVVIESMLGSSTSAHRGMSAPSHVKEEPVLAGSNQEPTLLKAEDGTEGEGNKGLVTGGWVVASVGFLLLLFVSIFLGILLLLGGVAMIAAGSPKKASEKGPKKEKRSTEEWQDVVYLQNGSVIRGMVIEQVPNVSLKIQTADGSVFVYEMKDVLKITKEQKP